jgi:hypothetical protein
MLKVLVRALQEIIHGRYRAATASGPTRHPVTTAATAYLISFWFERLQTVFFKCVLFVRNINFVNRFFF